MATGYNLPFKRSKENVLNQSGKRSNEAKLEGYLTLKGADMITPVNGKP